MPSIHHSDYSVAESFLSSQLAFDPTLFSLPTSPSSGSLLSSFLADQESLPNVSRQDVASLGDFSDEGTEEERPGRPPSFTQKDANTLIRGIPGFWSPDASADDDDSVRPDYDDNPNPDEERSDEERSDDGDGPSCLLGNGRGVTANHLAFPYRYRTSQVIWNTFFQRFSVPARFHKTFASRIRRYPRCHFAKAKVRSHSPLEERIIQKIVDALPT